MGTSWEGQAFQTLEKADNGGRRMCVDKLEYVHGLAIVTEGNAGGAFEAYVREAAERTLKEMDIANADQLAEAYPEFVAELLRREQTGHAPPMTGILTHEAVVKLVDEAVYHLWTPTGKPMLDFLI